MTITSESEIRDARPDDPAGAKAERRRRSRDRRTSSAARSSRGPAVVRRWQAVAEHLPWQFPEMLDIDRLGRISFAKRRLIFPKDRPDVPRHFGTNGAALLHHQFVTTIDHTMSVHRGHPVTS